jgi:hypothetical protein
MPATTVTARAAAMPATTATARARITRATAREPRFLSGRLPLDHRSVGQR